jgi:uncharacterized protein YndB with AHSA1/START domain
MNDMPRIDAFGALTEPTTLTIQRMLPGPIDRVWAYLTESDKRRQWLAAGDLELTPGAPFKFTWRNDQLTTPSGSRPEGWPEEHSMEQRVVAVDPPRKLVIGWGTTGQVSFDLETRGDKVLLTLVHRGLPGRPDLLNVAGGWHAHLDILVARVSGNEPEPFWDYWAGLRKQYEERLPG